MVDEQLVQIELTNQYNQCLQFSNMQLHTIDIDKICRQYYTIEYSEHYYDSEPYISEEWEQKELEGLNLWQDKSFLKWWSNACKEYEPQRIKFCNWIDPFAEGIWGLTQRQVNKISKNTLNILVSENNENRFYIAYENQKEYIHIYWYGRDTKEQMDRWWILRKRNKKENK